LPKGRARAGGDDADVFIGGVKGCAFKKETSCKGATTVKSAKRKRRECQPKHQEWVAEYVRGPAEKTENSMVARLPIKGGVLALRD